MKQNTIAKLISFSGIGLHSNVKVNVNIKPAPANTGIIFKRVDIRDKNNEIKALYKNVVDTQLGTTIANDLGVVVQTIEHFMGALWACSIDNAIIELDNKEVPIMDGSAQLFIDNIFKAGIKVLDEERRYLKVVKNVEIVEGDKFIKILPSDNYIIKLEVEFPYGNIGKQSIIFDGNQEEFIKNISKARTFCNEKEIEFMRQHGLALGGSLDNAMVFNECSLINKEGYRCEHEVVKHKLLDCIGDMFTCGYFMKCSIDANKIGHTLNNQILKKIFDDRNNYIII